MTSWKLDFIVKIVSATSCSFNTDLRQKLSNDGYIKRVIKLFMNEPILQINHIYLKIQFYFR